MIRIMQAPCLGLISVKKKQVSCLHLPKSLNGHPATAFKISFGISSLFLPIGRIISFGFTVGKPEVPK